MAENRVFLLPGEYHVARTPTQMATLLGSCVSVCLSHKTRPYAAMNHFLLAEAPPGDDDRGRYGDTSCKTILWLLSKLDPDLQALEARIYGGAAVVGHLGAQSEIGRKNVEIARKAMASRGIEVVEEKVGGTQGRRIYFDTAARRVTLREVRKTAESEALAKKRADIATRASRVLVVDDSPLVRKILRQAIETAPDLEVCGEAGDPFEARDRIMEVDPDVISLDIIMPRMDGLKFLKSLSEHFPKPVVIVSTIAKDRSAVSQRAYDYGAVAVIDKESLQLYRGLETVRRELLPKLRQAAHRVVRKRIFEKGS